MYGRFAALPDQALSLQRSQLMAAFFVGTALIQLRRICRRFDPSPGLDAALGAVAGGDSAVATARLADLDAALTSRPGTAALRARGLILAILEALTQHASFFDEGTPG
jgi:hypothetical protein